MKKKLMVFLLVLSLLLPTGVGGEAAADILFKDVPNDFWASKDIALAVSKGYVDGFPDGTFKPNQPVTRAQFIKMVVKALGMEHDAEGATWYETYVQAAKEAGIYQAQDFAEKDMGWNINREHMAWLAVRAADDKLLTVESSGIVREVTTRHIPESANKNKVVRTDAFMRDYYEGFLVHTAFARGIMKGYGGNVIGLDRTTTRAQAITVIERILSLREGKKLESDKYATGEAELLWLKTNAFTVAPGIFDDKAVNKIIYDLDNGLPTMKDSYMLEHLVIKNSTIHAEIKRVLLIDLSDPKDPYRNLLPPQGQMGIYVKKHIGKMTKDAYVIYMEYEVYKNSNPSVYKGQMRLDRYGYTSNTTVTDGILDDGAFLVAEDKYLNKLYVDPSGTGKGLYTLAIPKTKATLEKFQGAGNLSFTPMFQPWNGLNTISVPLFSGFTTHYER